MAHPATTSEPTRDRLISSARELFAGRGYQGTSVQEVLDNTNVSRGALYHHFPSKASLFEAVFESVEEQIAAKLVDAASGARSGKQALQAGCAAWFELTQDPAIRRIALIDAPTALGWAKWRAIDARHGFGLLAAALRSEADAGHLNAYLVDAYAHLLLAGLMEFGLHIAHADQPEAARRDAQQTIETLLDCLLPDNPPSEPRRPQPKDQHRRTSPL
jgi:AcrR family transcriptional regulator